MIFWLDDSRVPDVSDEDGVVWAKGLDEAISALSCREFSAAYLDHDLVLGEPTGLDVVMWMVQHDAVPPRVVIHSHNPLGAADMERCLRQWAIDRHRPLMIRVQQHGLEPWPEAEPDDDFALDDDSEFLT